MIAYTKVDSSHVWLDLLWAYFQSTLASCVVFLFLKCDLLLGMVDTIFADVAQPDQARIVAINAHHFLRNEGHVVISIKVFHALLNTVYVLFYFAMRTGFSSDSGLWPVPMDRDWHWSGTHNLALPWTECRLQSLQLHCTGSQVAQMARPHACVAQPFTCSLPRHCQYWIGTKPPIWRWLLLLDRLKFSFDWIVLTLLTNVSGKFEMSGK